MTRRNTKLWSNLSDAKNYKLANTHLRWHRRARYNVVIFLVNLKDTLFVY